MKRKTINTIVGVSVCCMLFSTFTGCGKKKEPETTTTTTTETATQQTINNDDLLENFDDIAKDVDLIETASQNNATITYELDDNENTNVEYKLTKLTFKDWGFSISVPTSLTQNYQKHSSMKDVSITSENAMEFNYLVTDEKSTFQLFKPSERYFAIFRDDDEMTPEFIEALQSKDHTTITSRITDNSIFAISSKEPLSFKYNDIAQGVYYQVTITPAKVKDLKYDGVALFFIVDNHLYYVLYGESSYYDIDTMEKGYAEAILKSIEINNPLTTQPDEVEYPDHYEFDIEELKKEYPDEADTFDYIYKQQQELDGKEETQQTPSDDTSVIDTTDNSFPQDGNEDKKEEDTTETTTETQEYKEPEVVGYTDDGEPIFQSVEE